MAGGNAVLLFEAFWKVRGCAESGSVTYFADGQLGVFDQMVSVIQPEVFDVFIEGNTQFIDKQSAEILGGVV